MQVSLNKYQRSILFDCMNQEHKSVTDVLTHAFKLLEQQLHKEENGQQGKEVPALQG